MPARLTVAAYEITAAKQLEEQLRESDLFRRHVFNFGPTAKVLTRPADRSVADLNAAAERWLGYPRAEILGRALDRFITWIDPAERARAAALLERDGRLPGFDFQYENWAGAPGWASWYVETLEPAGEPYHLNEFYDINARKRTQMELEWAAEDLRQMAVRLAETQDAERHALSRELHDRIGQNLSGLSLSLDILESRLPEAGRAWFQERLADQRRLVQESLDQVRDVMAALRPPMLDDFGLGPALRAYAARLARENGLACDTAGVEPAPRWAPTLEMSLFRIAQEALHNAVKYAQARTLSVALAETPAGWRLTVADDGRGLGGPPSRAEAGGYGQLIMRERALAAGANLKIESTPGAGTRVQVTVPRGEGHP